MGKTVEVRTDFKAQPWQRDLINGIFNNFKGYTHVVKSPRQCGKSTVLEMILLKVALENNKSVSMCISPTLQQSEKIFKELVEIIPASLLKNANSVKLSINLTNGSSILFKSGEQGIASLQGYTISGILCLDESSYISDDVFFAVLPFIRVHKAPLLLTSTPRFKTGFFYKYYMMGLEDGNKILSYDWTEYDLSAMLSEEDKETLRGQLPRQTYLCQVLGLFLDQEGSVFGDFSKCISNEVTEGLNTYVGIDWGACTGNDETAIAVFNSHKQMVDLIHFNDKDETQTIEAIMAVLRLYKPLKVIVEKNSIGNIFYGLLKKAIDRERLQIRLIPFNTCNESKERLVNNLQVELQNGTIQLLDDDDLTSELATYEMKLSSTGKKTYNAVSGAHDDLVIATMLGLEAATRKEATTFRFVHP